MGLSNLPPGVTDQMIDDHFGPGPCEPCEEGKHSDCEGDECRCPDCEEAAREDAADAQVQAWKERDLFPEQDEPDFWDEP
jgi:hypothetical protein